ncbi:hypothetical protein KSS87_006949 [Heliosperma pusillum]|nr:hypothetical protein KSS87_006949 [Heliosperma pusillum]
MQTMGNEARKTHCAAGAGAQGRTEFNTRDKGQIKGDQGVSIGNQGEVYMGIQGSIWGKGWVTKGEAAS